MNGALNNASMACELALGDAAGVDAATERTMRAGVSAIAQAARAAAVLAHLARDRGAPGESDEAYARDVREILHEQARSSGATPPPERDERAIDAAQAAQILVEELARMRMHGNPRA
jgi:hypothetical protein